VKIPWPIALNTGLALLTAGAAFWAYQTVTVADSSSTASTSGQRTVAVSSGTVVATVSATGSVQSANTANADFTTAGTVTEVDVKVGDTVSKGQVLAKVDPTAAQDSLNTARANLNSAQQALSRAQAATPADAATIAQAQAQVAADQSTVDSAQRAVDGTVLKAPMAGTITAVNGSVGASSSSSSGGSASGGGGGSGPSGGGSGTAATSSSSSSSSGFIQLADLTQLQIGSYFAEADATRLKLGQTATVAWSALTGARVTGKLASISPTATVQNNVNSYQVLVSLDSLPDGIRLGQTTSVSVTVGEADGVLRLPTAAVRSAGGRFLVTLASGGTVPVQVGLQGDTYDEITSGLTEGQLVVVPRQTTGTTGTGGFGGGGGLFGPGGGFGGGGRGGGNGGTRGGGGG
jgi:multidrug efflux pump subunit AcrA (membrane-fusion protein)